MTHDCRDCHLHSPFSHPLAHRRVLSGVCKNQAQIVPCRPDSAVRARFRPKPAGHWRQNERRPKPLPKYHMPQKRMIMKARRPREGGNPAPFGGAGPKPDAPELQKTRFLLSSFRVQSPMKSAMAPESSVWLQMQETDWNADDHQGSSSPRRRGASAFRRTGSRRWITRRS
jgi:hypothetical protein